ncbi:MAG: pyruvate kinase [Candidatus Cloacimonetes bacterium]|nr:pyruvate kinase [Candidatus Cloacimonadota bacterium]
MKTKIIATISRFNGTPELISGMIKAGAGIFRINMSHCTHPEADELIASLKTAEGLCGIDTKLMIDLAGPEVRLLGLKEPLISHNEMILELNDETEGIHLSLPDLGKMLKPKMQILLQDGQFTGEVLSVDDTIRIRLLGTGEIKPNAHVSLPDIEYPLEFVSSKDIADLEYAMEVKADYIAISFVHRAANIDYYRSLINKNNNQKKPLITAKFESKQSLENIDEIIEAGDCFFVARGDMGTENPLELLPYYQKQIIKKSCLAGKEAFVATQMLESMVHNPLPTRAEVTDIANAVLDGAAALTLSGETAIGKYPVETIKMMKKIAEKAEEYKYKL